MTKEEFIRRCENGNMTMDNVYSFFEANICIPKGTNRHPSADEFHAYAEGTPIQHSFDGITWIDTTFVAVKYRIKPSEPVYEWQWIQTEDGETYWLTGYMTKYEANQCGCTIAVEDTKRERNR